MLILMQFLGFEAKNQWKGGGGTCLVVPLIWQSFIQIEEMACITPAWSSGKLSLK